MFLQYRGPWGMNKKSLKLNLCTFLRINIGFNEFPMLKNIENVVLFVFLSNMVTKLWKLVDLQLTSGYVAAILNISNCPRMATPHPLGYYYIHPKDK